MSLSDRYRAETAPVALSAVVPQRPTIQGEGDLAVRQAAKPLKLTRDKKTNKILMGPVAVRKLLVFVEPYWHQHKRYPPDLELMQKFQLSAEELAAVNRNKFYVACLKERGIAPPDAPGYLTERQIAAIAVITNFNDRRDVNVRLADLGVTGEELQGWYSNPEFKRRLADRAQDAFDNVGSYATTNLARAIERGNFQAIKFYYEITGQAQTPEAVNARRLIQALVEAVQKHVKDPEVLKAISTEVQAVAGIQQVVNG